MQGSRPVLQVIEFASKFQVTGFRTVGRSLSLLLKAPQWRASRQRNPNNRRSLKIAFWPMSQNRLILVTAKIAMLMDAILRARDVVAARSWSTSQEPASEHWWADVLADPRARRRRVSRGLGGRMVERAFYTLADEPHPMIIVACTKCPWQAAFSRADLTED
jgi:hypothetical protein